MSHLQSAFVSLDRPTETALTPPFSPDVIVSAEDHAAFRVARRADFAQLGLAAGALQAAAVPVGVHGVEEEAVCDFAPAARTPLPGQGTGAHRRRLAAASRIHHGL